MLQQIESSEAFNRRMQDIGVGSQVSQKRQKTKEEYSRNVKKLKYKLNKVSQQIDVYMHRIQKLQNTSNDRVISMKILKFWFKPEMLFRFADVKCRNCVSRVQFRNILVSLGLRLAQEQLTRLEYLLDEDISGDISWEQYNKYLHAFGMKRQHSTDDAFVKEALQKLDINKLLQMAKGGDQSPARKHRILMNYQQFLKYCHKEFPNLSNKQLNIIFNQLSRNDLIDLDDLLGHLKRISDKQAQLQRLDKNNRKKKSQGQKIAEQQDQNSQKEQEEKIDISTLKGQIMSVVRQHPKLQQIFHSSEFKRVERMKQYGVQKGKMTTLFKQMDLKFQGSIGYNQIIVYYVDKQTFKPNNDSLIKFAFILMGKKMISQNQKPESLVQTYSSQKPQITLKQFQKLCKVQFQLNEQHSNMLYEVMLRCPGFQTQQNQVQTCLLINLMKFDRRDFKHFVKPLLTQDFTHCFYKRSYQTICTDGLVAFKICTSLSEQLAKLNQKWNDYEFGPTPEDQFGYDSLGTSINAPNIKWFRTSKLKMNQFFIPSSKADKIYVASGNGSSDLFCRSFEMLVKQDPRCFNREIGEIMKQGKNIEEVQLNKLFEGLHPLVFHKFQVWGVYVFKFYVRGRWFYVITDDKIPCSVTEQKNRTIRQPLYSKSSNRNCSYVSLIEKAYAKLKGSYEKTFEVQSLPQFLYELSSLLSYNLPIQSTQRGEDLQLQWEQISYQTNLLTQKRQLTRSQQKKESYCRSYLTNQIISDRKDKCRSDSGLEGLTALGIWFSVQIRSEKPEILHRLILLNRPGQLHNENKWNKDWNVDSPNYRKYSSAIKSQLLEWDKDTQHIPTNQNQKTNALVLDLDRVRQLFSSVFIIKTFMFNAEMVILRKYLQFQKDHSCLYKVNSTDKQKPLRLIVLLNKIKGPQSARLSITMKNTQQQKHKQNKSKSFLIKDSFACIRLWVPQEQQDLQIKIDKFDPDQQYIYQLTFYFDNKKYQLKQRDRHLLFKSVTANDQSNKLDFNILSQQQKKYFYQKYFPNAGRKGIFCC